MLSSVELCTFKYSYLEYTLTLVHALYALIHTTCIDTHYYTLCMPWYIPLHTLYMPWYTPLRTLHALVHTTTHDMPWYTSFMPWYTPYTVIVWESSEYWQLCIYYEARHYTPYMPWYITLQMLHGLVAQCTTPP